MGFVVMFTSATANVGAELLKVVAVCARLEGGSDKVVESENMTTLVKN